MTARLEWGEGNAADIRNRVDLAKQLEALDMLARQTRPFVVELVINNGDALSAGLGRALSILSFVSRSKLPPYYTSSGETDPSCDVLQFDYGGEPTEYSASQAVPSEVAVQALKAFFETGELPDFVKWLQI